MLIDVGTQSAPIFKQTARELAARLAKDNSATARGLAEEAQHLVDVFDRWQTEDPSDTERLQSIEHLVNLNRRVLDYVSRHRDSSSKDG